MVWNGIERRRGSDWRIRLLRVLTLASWLLYIVCLLLFHFARPEMNTGIARYYGVSVRHHWDPLYSETLLYLIWLCSGLSLVSLLMGIGRGRRCTDTRRYNLMLLTIVALVSGILLTYQILFS